MELNQPRIDLKKQPTIICEECSSKYFQEVVLIKKVPGILVGNKEDSIVPFPTYKCVDCGHVNKEFAIFDEDNPINLNV